ncbi:MAG TPA: hypothetical protein VLJ62_18565 [Burkholderiaceae bacterium]|nr:hypothetical protein [Burkholderiaceae bacterium]
MGAEVSVGIDRAVAVHELIRSGYSASYSVTPKRLHDAGLSEADVAAGRLVQVSCATMTDGWWDSLAVVPAGMTVRPGQVVLLRVDEATTNERVGLNRISGPVVPALPNGMLAYRFIPDWQSRGLSRNYERVALPVEQEGRYHIVQGSYKVKCRP